MDRAQYVIGLLTLLFVLVAGWFLFGLLSDDGQKDYFRFRIEFRDARGLKSGAAVKYRGVRVGTVRRILPSDDGEKAVVSVFLEPGTEHLARHSSGFWIVSPRFSGFSGGVTGLDTLVRDSYLAFLTPQPSGPRLSPGSLLGGLEQPIDQSRGRGLDPVRHGDLEMVLLVPENHGLVIGSEVRFRGVRCGEVRGIGLAEDGRYVELGLRITQRHRHMITDKSMFWVARPRISGALLSGMAVEDFGALLSPFVAFHTKVGMGLPVADNYRCAALADRPDIGDQEVPEDAVALTATHFDEGSDIRVKLVRVAYEAVEDDWFTADDQVKREGTGILCLDQSGRPVVITCRSICDAGFITRDVFGGDAEIKSEAIRIIVPGGGVLRAGRTWVDPMGRDLAVLTLEGASSDLPVTDSSMFRYVEKPDTGPSSFLVAGSLDSLELSAGSLPSLQDNYGAACLQDNKVVAILGQKTGIDTQAVLVPLALLPAGLRPRQ